MPTYEYECGKCGHRMEHFQSMTEKPLKKCPKCAKSSLQRLIGSGSGVIFKGSGFYETDYKRAGSKKESSGESGGAKESKPAEPSKPAASPASSGGESSKA